MQIHKNFITQILLKLGILRIISQVEFFGLKNYDRPIILLIYLDLDLSHWESKFLKFPFESYNFWWIYGLNWWKSGENDQIMICVIDLCKFRVFDKNRVCMCVVCVNRDFKICVNVCVSNSLKKITSQPWAMGTGWRRFF